MSQIKRFVLPLLVLLLGSAGTAGAQTSMQVFGGEAGSMLSHGNTRVREAFNATVRFQAAEVQPNNTLAPAYNPDNHALEITWRGSWYAGPPAEPDLVMTVPAGALVQVKPGVYVSPGDNPLQKNVQVLVHHPDGSVEDLVLQMQRLDLRVEVRTAGLTVARLSWVRAVIPPTGGDPNDPAGGVSPPTNLPPLAAAEVLVKVQGVIPPVELVGSVRPTSFKAGYD